MKASKLASCIVLAVAALVIYGVVACNAYHHLVTLAFCVIVLTLIHHEAKRESKKGGRR